MADLEAARIKLLFENASMDSKFTVSRLMNLNNFNRSHMAVNNLPDLGNSIINAILDPNGNEKELFQGGDPEVQQYLCSKGISLIEGSYITGKSSLVPKIVMGYQKITEKKTQDEEMKKNRMKNLKKYTIKDIMENDSSSDEEEDQVKT
jgi:hypothetical protein